LTSVPRAAPDKVLAATCVRRVYDVYDVCTTCVLAATCPYRDVRTGGGLCAALRRWGVLLTSLPA
jgi:hypothetical protein